ncbi:MAG: HPr family phosphocarrier protein [Bacteroidales bacterium]|nr:HPr family phosphocarrier protein [Lachnoclostridium sp.]MCM1384973.1 HPr family phosphocarrier protein [Lachnoclostridium sp.]MCM1465861.1 HPr family phosphocarrier protein [Bacteroidales bacterium]
MDEERLWITFHDKNEVLHFVADCCHYDSAIDVKLDRQVTDAKSVMGMLLLQLEQPMEIVYDSYKEELGGYEEFRRQMLEEYDVQATLTGSPS